MEKYLIWYKLWVKMYWKKKSYWLQILGMVLLLMALSSISIPENSNVVAGIYYEKSSSAEMIARQLMEENSIFTFREYDSEEELYREVTSGKVECGFIFSEDFDHRMENGNLKEAIRYICTPLTVRGEVAQETLYAALLQMYSDEILKRSEEEIYGEVDFERSAELLEWNQYFREGDNVFRLEIETMDVGVWEAAGETLEGTLEGTLEETLEGTLEETLEGTLEETLEGTLEETSGETLEMKTYPIQGMAGVFVFLIMFLAYGRKFESGGSAVEKALDRKERLIYGYISNIAAGTLPMIVGCIMILLMTGVGNAGKEILLMLLFLLISGIWIMAVGGGMRRSTSFISGAAVVTVAGMLICPVFVNWNVYVPALKYVSCIFPLGVYLYMHTVLF